MPAREADEISSERFGGGTEPVGAYSGLQGDRPNTARSFAGVAVAAKSLPDPAAGAPPPNERPGPSGAASQPVRSPLIDRIGKAAPGEGSGIGTMGLGLPDDGRQLENLSPKVLHPSGQRQILPA